MRWYWVYDIPDWLFTLLTVLVTVAIGLGGMFATRRWVSRLHHAFSHNEMVSYYLGAVGVFYGITLGLISIGSWQTYSDVEEKATLEAASLAAIWRDVSSYPEPARTVLRDYLRNYTRDVIDFAWRLQRKGITPPSGPLGHLYFTHFEEALNHFEPATNGQMALHAEALRQLNTLTTLRRLRLRSVTSGLPASMWILVLAGAFVNLAVTWFFRANNVSVHFWMTLLLSVILGLLIHMLAAVDNPYRGKVSVGPDAFELVYQQLMKPDT
jgi:hypothetical protein